MSPCILVCHLILCHILFDPYLCLLIAFFSMVNMTFSVCYLIPECLSHFPGSWKPHRGPCTKAVNMFPWDKSSVIADSSIPWDQSFAFEVDNWQKAVKHWCPAVQMFFMVDLAHMDSVLMFSHRSWRTSFSQLNRFNSHWLIFDFWLSVKCSDIHWIYSMKRIVMLIKSFNERQHSRSEVWLLILFWTGLLHQWWIKITLLAEHQINQMKIVHPCISYIRRW